MEALLAAELPDGDYVLRVRAIDAQGLEGRDADLRFRLKARPEPPLPSAPAPRAVTVGGRVEFAWAANPQAATYELQLAAEPTLTRAKPRRPKLPSTFPLARKRATTTAPEG